MESYQNLPSILLPETAELRQRSVPVLHTAVPDPVPDPGSAPDPGSPDLALGPGSASHRTVIRS